MSTATRRLLGGSTRPVSRGKHPRTVAVGDYEETLGIVIVVFIIRTDYRSGGHSVRPVYPKPSTAIASIVPTADTTTPQNILRDGQVLIFRNGKTCTVTAVEVK